jgi:hypothetical protein
MIHLNSRAAEKDKILEVIGYAVDNPEYELECLINNSSNRHNPSITHDNFISIVKRFKGRSDFEDNTNTRLAISFPATSKYNDVRVLIKGIGPINSYCNNENISLIRNSVDFETKTFPKVKNTRVLIPNYNIKFNLKEEKNFNNNESRIKDLLRDWDNEPKNFRYKKTFSFIKKTKDFQIDVSIVKSSSNLDRFLTVKEIIDNKLMNYVVKPTEVRDFVGWWKSIEDKPTEKVMVRNASNYYKNIKDSSVFTNIPTYEVEVEYIKNKTQNKPKFKNVDEKNKYINDDFVGFFKYIGAVLQCVQGSIYILNNDEKEVIKKHFINVVQNSITENMLKTNDEYDRQRKHRKKGRNNSNQDGGSVNTNTTYSMDSDNELSFNHNVKDDSENKVIADWEKSENEDKFQNFHNVDHSDDNDHDNDNDTELPTQMGGARKLADLKFEIGDQLRRKIFFGPLIIDLMHNNALEIDKSAIPDPKTNTNIHINYLVTDKTDGERNLLFIDENGNTYGVDRESNIKSYGIIMPGLANTILDGEYIDHTEDNKLINNFYIFDAYIYKGESVISKPFLFNRSGGRHICILDSVKYFNTGTNITQSNNKMPFMLFKKDYLPSNSPASYSSIRDDEIPLISENCGKLLNKMNKKYGGYLTEGHLFTYKTDGLVFLPNNLGVFQSHEDDYVRNPFIRGRWNNNYKWKPSANLTIDFEIEFVKDSKTKLLYNYVNSRKYLRVNLISAVYQNKHNDNNKLNFYLLNSGLKISSIPTEYKFFATDPFIGSYDEEGNLQNNMGDAYFEVDSNDNIIAENGDFITDGVICECSYDISNKEEQYRWKPHKVRNDKTSANAYGTAIAIWKLINNPITNDQLSGSKYSKDTEDTEDTEEGSESNVNLENVAYYISNKNLNVLTKPFNKFSSNVKGYLINRCLTGYIKPKVLDLAVGKFGDMPKYVKAGVHTLIGMDISEDSINNQDDGAATRIMDMSAKSPAVNKFAEKTMLIVGTSAKNFANGESVRDNINKYYVDVLYGRAKGNTPKLRKMEGIALDQFDMVTCMYAIHYIMNTETELDNLLRNVSENLLDQGYFIGTCLDGMAILQDMGKSNEISGVINGKTVFFIRKMDDENNYTDISVGNKVMVYYEKFAGYFPENLVNISYLREKAKEHNLKLVEFRKFLEEPGNLLSQFGSVNPKMADAVKESDAMMQWAKFNCYFIFQKVRSSD